MGWVRICLTAIAASALLALGAGQLAAHGGGKMPKPFMQRHALMTSLAVHMKATGGAIARNDLAAVGRHAMAIHWLARVMPDSFPKGSGAEMGKTRALPKIWSDWKGFVAAADVLAHQAEKLAKAAKSGDANAVKAQFAETGRQGCGSCHKAYRAPKN